MAMLGVGSYAFRWSVGIGDRRPPDPMSHLDVLEVAREEGLALVQFADNMPLHDLSSAAIEDLARRARQLGMTLEVGQQGSDMSLLSRYIEIARVLDAKILRMALDAADADIPLDKLSNDFHSALREVGDSGIVIAIENHFGFPSARLAELVQMVDSKSLGVCLDVANSICAGEWPEETIERLAPLTVNLHLKDYEITPDPYGVGFRIAGTPLGRGRTDISRVLDQIRRSGTDCNVILEHWLPWTDDPEELVRCERDWLRQSVAKARQYLPAV